jgi:hypothetical protein
MLARPPVAYQEPPAPPPPSAHQESVARPAPPSRRAEAFSVTGYPAVEQPAVGYPAVEYPAVGYPAVGYPAVEHPAVGYLAVEHRAVEYPAVGYPAVEYPAVGYPAVVHPAVGYPAVERPVVEYPVVEYPVADQPQPATWARGPLAPGEWSGPRDWAGPAEQPAGGWLADSGIHDAATTAVAAHEYGALPAVSIPTGALAPASVPLPVDDAGPGLTALADDVIDVIDVLGPAATPAPARAQPVSPPAALPAQVAGPGWEVAVVGVSPVPATPAPPTGGALFDVSAVVVDAAPVVAGGPGAAGTSLLAPPPLAPPPVTSPSVTWPPVAPPVPPAPAPRRPPLADMSPAQLATVMTELAATAAAAANAVGAGEESPGVAVGAPFAGLAPLPPYRSPRRASGEDLAARYTVVREQVDYAMAEIALARAAFRRACTAEGPGWPFRDSEEELLRRPAVAHALACELAGVERLRVWAQELHWLREQQQSF